VVGGFCLGWVDGGQFYLLNSCYSNPVDWASDKFSSIALHNEEFVIHTIHHIVSEICEVLVGQAGSSYNQEDKEWVQNLCFEPLVKFSLRRLGRR
jgi:hypothetical protein